MTRIEKLRARRNEKAGEINTKSKELQGLLAKDDATLDDIKGATTAKIAADAELKAIDDELATLVAADQAAAAAAAPAAAALPSTGSTYAQPKSASSDKDKVGIVIYGMIKAFRLGGQKGSAAAFDLLDREGYGQVAAEFDAGTKGLVTTTGSAGGLTVPPNFNEVILDMLTPQSAFLRGRPRQIPMPTGSYRQSALLSRPTVAYRAEAAAGNVSSPTFREFTMAAKHLTGIVPMSNQIINWTANRASAMAQQSLSAAMGLKIDSAMLLGTGASDTPTGIFNIAGITSFAATSAVAPTPDVIDADVRKLLNVVETYGELQDGLAWVMPQRLKGYLADLRLKVGTDFGAKVYPEIDATGTWKGKPVLVSSQMPINGGAGTNEGTLGLVSFGTVLLGEAAGMTLSVSEEATVGGVNLWETDQTGIRATLSHDVNVQYAESVGKLTAVKWGA